MSCNDKSFTVTFDEKVTGWTSFHSFVPDFCIGMNNRFFTFKNGNLYEHHSDMTGRNNYYGQTFPSKVSVMMNDAPSDIKEVQAVSLEGNHAWDTTIKAFKRDTSNFDESTIKRDEYNNKEGFWYAYARRNENPTQVDSKAVYGLGKVESISGNSVVINGFSDLITIGDRLINANLTVIGNITNHNRVDNKTTIQLTSTSGLVVGAFVAGRKDSRVEGGNLRGYTLRFDLVNNVREKVELFAVNSEVMKSFL